MSDILLTPKMLNKANYPFAVGQAVEFMSHQGRGVVKVYGVITSLDDAEDRIVADYEDKDDTSRQPPIKYFGASIHISKIVKLDGKDFTP